MKEKFPLLPRKKNTNKTHYGHVLILAGSRAMPGAAILAARASLKSGSGLVTLGAPRSLHDLMAKAVVEAMHLDLPETKRGTLSFPAFLKVKEFVRGRKISALLVGPGLSHEPQTVKFVRKIIGNVSLPVVLDADGLNSFKAAAPYFKKASGPLILTPHQAEFERVFGEKLPESRKSRIQLAKKLSKSYHVVLVMKGPRTLVVEGDRVYVNQTGNPGMAKGGAGDVLSGMIASFIAQGLEPFKAARWAVFFHGKAADIAVKDKGELGLTASDIIEYLPKAFRFLLE